MAYATSVTVSDVDTHICGACKTQFAAIEDFLSHKRNGCFSFLTALPASLLSEYLSSVVVIPSSDLINSDTLSNQFDLNQQQICHAGAELAGYQMSSMPSDHSLLELQQNALQQVADVTSLTKYDQCSLDEISNINLSCQFGFETLSSESVVQLSQLMVEPSGAEPVSDGNIIISSVLSQRDNNVVVSQCESGDPDSLLMPYAAADVTESLFDEHAEVKTIYIPMIALYILEFDHHPFY